jgi:hypothetical protein
VRTAEDLCLNVSRPPPLSPLPFFSFVSFQVLRLCGEALRAWLLNVVEQNRVVTGNCERERLGAANAFASMLRGSGGGGFDTSLARFLFSQWGEDLSQQQLDVLRGAVADHLQSTHDPARDAFTLEDVNRLRKSGNGTGSGGGSCGEGGESGSGAHKLGGKQAGGGKGGAHKIKIRGLRNRGDAEFEEDADTMKARRKDAAAGGHRVKKPQGGNTTRT